MSAALDRSAGGGVRERVRAAVLLAVHGLGLAATPAFILMAWLTADWAGGNPAMICASGSAGSWLGGMTPMYLLMGAVHSRPWLTLIGGRRSGGERGEP